MNNTATRGCNACGVVSFKTNQAYLRHLLTNKHKLRQESTREDLYQCNQCNKWYCGKSGLSHHKNTCGSKISSPIQPQPTIPPPTTATTDPIQEVLQQQMEAMKQSFEKERQEMKKEFEESMKEQINKILENHAAAAPVLVQTTTTNIIDNRTNNNITININTFGDENIDYIDDKAWLSYINRCYKSIPYLLERIHFDPKHPENHNIRTTNKKLPYTSVVGKNKKRRIMDRKDAVETMVQNGFIIIDEKYTELKDRLPSSKQQNYEGFQTLFEAQDKELMKRLHKDIDMLLLNGGNC